MGNKPVKVLQILIGGKTFSGVASYLYQYYKHMDHDQVHFDFLFCRENSMELVMNAPELEGSLFHVLHAVKGKSNDYRAIVTGLRETLEKYHYDVVVVNTSIIAVIYACMQGVKDYKDTLFIAHAHNTDLILGKNSLRRKLGFIVRLADDFMRVRIRKKSHYLFACSEEAGRITFGSEAVGMPGFRLIRNAIDAERFIYNEQTRKAIRKELNTADSTCVYGNVGSFCKRKNQLFLLEVFQEICAIKPDSELWLIGDGADREKILAAIKERKLGDKVKLLGQRSDVNALMQGMDCFVFSTLSEGLGIVAIEAQAADVYTFVSDGVPNDVLITDHVCQMKLADGAKSWAETIVELSLPRKRRDVSEAIGKAGYEIRTEAKKMTSFFTKEMGLCDRKE